MRSSPERSAVVNLVVFITLAVAALLTAFYTARQITMVFLGTPRSKAAEHAIETKPVMTIPLVILAFFAITLGWVGIPHAFPVLGKVSTSLVPGILWVRCLPWKDIAEAHSLIPLITSVIGLVGRAPAWVG